MTSGAITDYNGDDKIDFLSTAGAATTGVEIDDDTIILYVDTDDLNNNTGSTNEGAMEVADDSIKDILYTANAMYQDSLSNNGVADVIVYDVNDNLNGDDLACQVTGGLTAAQIEEVLDQTGAATVNTDLGASAVVNVEANQTLTITAAQTSGMKVVVDKDAKVVLPSGAAFGKGTDATADGDVTIAATATGGIEITAEAGTKLTLASEVTIGSKDTNNFYEGASESAATQVADSTIDGAYTWTTGLTAAGNVSGWFKVTA